MNYKFKTSIIIINYNGKRYIDNLFYSLENLKTNKEDFEVVFVDNASSDDSLAYIEQKYNVVTFNLKIVRSEKNLGFSGGNNLGVDKAEGEYIVLLNNDTAVEPDWLNPLVNIMEKQSNVGIVNSKLLFFYDYIRIDVATVEGINLLREVKINGDTFRIEDKMAKNMLFYGESNKCKCLDNSIIQIPLLHGVTDYEIEITVNGKIDGYDYFLVDFERAPVKKGVNTFRFSKKEVAFLKETLVQNAGSGINDWNDGYDIGFGQPDGEKFNSSYEVMSGCGASIIMRKCEFLKLGGFDERFFMYYEDTDFSYRMRKTGKKILFCPESRVRHIHTGSSKEWSPFFTYHVVRNKLLFIYKNISKEVFEAEYKSAILTGIRSRKNGWLRIRAARDARKIIKGNKNIRY